MTNEQQELLGLAARLQDGLSTEEKQRFDLLAEQLGELGFTIEQDEYGQFQCVPYEEQA